MGTHFVIVEFSTNGASVLPIVEYLTFPDRGAWETEIAARMKQSSESARLSSVTWVPIVATRAEIKTTVEILGVP
jgi:hypothetical protein